MFNIIVAGTIVASANSKEEAEMLLEKARKSPLGWCHPYDVFRIEKVGA